MLTLALALAVADDLPKDVQEALAKADTLELLSLDPSREGKPTEGFRGWGPPR